MTGRCFSTTGRAFDANGEAPSDGKAPVELVRMDEPHASAGERLSLGGSCPSSVTLSRHLENEAVLQHGAASKVHCHLALRGFRISDQKSETIHEGLFVRDVSKNLTLVNGTPAYRPWHWLQHGDVIGIHPDPSRPDGVVNVFRVTYALHTALASEVVECLPTATVEVNTRPLPNPQIAVRPAPVVAAPTRDLKAVLKRRRGHAGFPSLREQVIGCVVDITYVDPPPTTVYRMRITGYEKKEGFHTCDSEGLSLWDGECFTDVVDLNLMFNDGLVQFVEDGRKIRKM